MAIARVRNASFGCSSCQFSIPAYIVLLLEFLEPGGAGGLRVALAVSNSVCPHACLFSDQVVAKGQPLILLFSSPARKGAINIGDLSFCFFYWRSGSILRKQILLLLA